MFFDIILLNSQHGGRFGIAWLAATRGLRFVTKKQIKELNLLKLCDDLKLFIISHSASPKKRFSLRLSAILINGVVKIFKEQATTLQGEVFSLISTIHIPSGIGYVAGLTESGIFETPPTPIPKTKKKRGRKLIKETPEIIVQNRADEMILQLPNVEDILQLTARADEISIREEMPKRIERAEDDFSLGILSRKEVEEEMQLLLAKPQEIPLVHPQSSSSDFQPPPTVIEVVAQIHAPKDGFEEDLRAVEHPRRETEYALETISKQIEPHIEQITEHISIIESVPVIQPVHTELIVEKEHPISELPAVVQTPAQEHPQSDLLAQELREAAKASKTKKGERRQLAELQDDEVTQRSALVTQKREKVLLKPFRNKFVRINRCNENNGQFIDEFCELPLAYKAGLNESLYNLFWMDEVFENIQIRGVSTLKSLSLGESGGLRRTDTISAQPSTLESISDTGIRQSVQPLEIPDQEAVLARSKRHTEDTVKQISIEEPIVPTSTPRKRKRLTTDDGELQRDTTAQPVQVPLDENIIAVPEEITFPDQITVTEQIAVPHHPAIAEAITSQEVEAVVQEQLPLATIPHVMKTRETPSPSDYKLRQQRIIDIVAKWTPSQGMITIEHVCEKPIHRLNIARAFSDLLSK